MIRPELFHNELYNFFTGISQGISPDDMKDLFINFMMVEYLNLHYTRAAKTLHVSTRGNEPLTLPIVGFELAIEGKGRRRDVRVRLADTPADRNIVGELNKRYGDTRFIVESIVDKEERNIGLGRIDLSDSDVSVLDTLVRMAYGDAVRFMITWAAVSPRPAPKLLESGKTMYNPSYGNPISAAVVVKYQFSCNDQGHDTCVHFVAEAKDRSVYSGSLVTLEEFFECMNARPMHMKQDPVSDDEAALLKRFVDIVSSKED